MSYATLSDVLTRYRPVITLVGSEPNNQVSSADVGSVFIAGAEGIINAYLGQKYIIPLQPSPLITAIASDLSIYSMMVELLPEVPDAMQNRYDRNIKLLEQLRDGEMVVVSATLVTTGDSEAWSNTQDFHQVFSPVLDPLDQSADKDRIVKDVDTRRDDANNY